MRSAAGFNWVATFDQDSRVSDGFISQMLQTYRQASHPERIALIAPTYVDQESGIPGPLVRARNGEILHTMTSGSMMPSSAIQKLGVFDESLYMDYVDIEFCLRARRMGMLILQSPAVLFHSLGRITHHRIFGRWLRNDESFRGPALLHHSQPSAIADELHWGLAMGVARYQGNAR